MWIWQFSKIKQYFLLLLSMFTDTKKFFLKTKLSRKDAEDLVCVVMYITMIPVLFTIFLIPLVLLVPLFAWVSRVLFEFFVGIILQLVNLKIKDLHEFWALSYSPMVIGVFAVTQPIAAIGSMISYFYLLIERYNANGTQIAFFILLSVILFGLLAVLIMVPFFLLFGLTFLSSI